MLLRVIISERDIRKVTLDTVPDTVHGLKEVLRSKLQLTDCFDLQYEDKDFNDFCNLSSVTDLSKDKATLKILISPPDTVSDSSLDTAVLPVSQSPSTSTQVTSSFSQLKQSRLHTWPAVFTIPTFSYDVELRLKHGNEAYSKDGTLLKMSRDMQTEILDKLAEGVFAYKAYPDKEEIKSVAIALVEKHPCLKERGSAAGWYGWKLSLTWKMGNYRSKLRDAGCNELQVNSTKRGTGGVQGQQNKVKKPKRSETNFLPDLPAGRDQKTLEHERELMCQEMKKRSPDMSFVDASMSSTYALRRQEIIYEEPPVSEMKKRWPALFCERQISAEFNRLMTLDLSKSFYEGIDRHLPKLLCLYRSKRCMDIVEMRAIMDSLDKNASNQRKRIAVLQGLPWIMRENPSQFVKICEHTDSEEEMTRGMTLGILTVVADVTDPIPCSSSDVALVIEEAVVLRGLGDIPNAYVNMMGLLYALNINYPKNLRYTFEVIQRLLMNISADTCSSRVHSLKNTLLN
ncbi:sterile alpha motif domain-containing protein 3-like isoform X2 [Triplophysa rosa]|nr:sterile alpha motif domain-containing protein 3-like isoform X2 [Triplophysa rosa]XP_057192280.1 sterile alpha motif domain-containing protein 3-like isoform X2 [Triplophysa rosa]